MRNALINHCYLGNSSSLNDIVPDGSRLWIKTLQLPLPLLLISDDRGGISCKKNYLLRLYKFFFKTGQIYFLKFPFH